MSAIANLAGYSMGGYGCWQLGGYDPDLWTAVIPVASYGIGTLQGKGQYDAPQPESASILRTYLASVAPQLARIPVIIAVHAVSDMTSYFPDVKLIVDTVKGCGGNASMAVISAEHADSDKGKRKIKSGHHYFNYALLNDTSEQVLYARLRFALQQVLAKSRAASKTSPRPLYWNGGGSAAAGRHGKDWAASRSPRRQSGQSEGSEGGGIISALLSIV